MSRRTFRPKPEPLKLGEVLPVACDAHVVQRVFNISTSTLYDWHREGRLRRYDCRGAGGADMSRYDYGDPGSDDAYCDGLSEPGVIARCADCGDQFRTVIADIGARCDACWEERDAHTLALEAAAELKRMAKVILSADLTKVKEVA